MITQQLGRPAPAGRPRTDRTPVPAVSVQPEAAPAAALPVSPSRAILEDRWDSVMEWERTGGNATEVYVALAGALHTLTAVVAGLGDETGRPGDRSGGETDNVMTEDVLDRVRDVVIDAAIAGGIVR